MVAEAEKHLDRATKEFEDDGYGFWGFAFKPATETSDEEFMVVGGKKALDSQVIVDNTLLALMLLTGTSNKQELAAFITQPEVKIYHA